MQRFTQVMHGIILFFLSVCLAHDSPNGTPTSSTIPNIHTIQVGMNGLTFTPNQIMANPGDQVKFIYNPKNHSVTQSSFTEPCVPESNGFNSGFRPTTSNDVMAMNQSTFLITINDTKPIWVFCAQSGHCQKGMVFAINPTPEKTFSQFQQMAMNNITSTISTPSTTMSTMSTFCQSQSMGMDTGHWDQVYQYGKGEIFESCDCECPYGFEDAGIQWQISTDSWSNMMDSCQDGSNQLFSSNMNGFNSEMSMDGSGTNGMDSGISNNVGMANVQSSDINSSDSSESGNSIDGITSALINAPDPPPDFNDTLTDPNVSTNASTQNIPDSNTLAVPLADTLTTSSNSAYQQSSGASTSKSSYMTSYFIITVLMAALYELGH